MARDGVVVSYHPGDELDADTLEDQIARGPSTYAHAPGPCREWLSDERGRCGRAGEGARVHCHAGRPDADGGPYCDAHGGFGRALDEARTDWCYLAPARVGDAAAVHSAGHACLQTPDRYVVLRQLDESQGGVWLAWLGLGSMQDPVPNPVARPPLRANGKPKIRGGRKHRRKDGKLRSEAGAYAFETRQHAETRARALWRARLDEHVRRITEARGGTLDWGVPVEPAESPILILLEQGDRRSAWDIAVTLPRRSREGFAAISGLRPSGEVA